MFGCSYIRYSQICAMAVRRSLKSQFQHPDMARKDASTIKVTKWESGKPQTQWVVNNAGVLSTILRFGYLKFEFLRACVLNVLRVIISIGHQLIFPAIVAESLNADSLAPKGSVVSSSSQSQSLCMSHQCHYFECNTVKTSILARQTTIPFLLVGLQGVIIQIIALYRTAAAVADRSCVCICRSSAV